MANEITLKTRLLNLYEDSNGTRFTSTSADNNIRLKKGEILFHEEMVATDKGETPVVLMKVGDGVTTNDQLNVVAARAADVYKWAKAATKPDYKASEIDYTKTNKKYDDEGNLVEETTEDITTQKAIDALYDAIATLSGDSGASIADLITRIGTIESDYLKEADLAPYAKTADLASYATVEALNAEVTRATKAEKANADAITAIKNGKSVNSFGDVETELAKKVDKVNDKSLVSNTEIAKLAGVSVGANKVEASTNGKIKIDGVDTAVYTHPDKHSIAEVNGLQNALDGKQAAGDYSVEGHKHTKADITDFTHTHTASDITNLDNTIKAYDYATKAEAQGYVNAYKTTNDQALANEVKAREDADIAINNKIGTVAEGKTVVEMISNAQTAAATDATTKANTAETNAKAYTDEVKDQILGEGIKDTFDTLVEIQTWIEGNGVDATELSSAIAAEAKLRADADAAEAKTRAEADSALSDRIKAYEDVKDTYATKTALESVSKVAEAATTVAEVDAQIDTKITALNLDTRFDNDYDAIGAADAALEAAKAYADANDADTTYSAKAEGGLKLEGTVFSIADASTGFTFILDANA